MHILPIVVGIEQNEKGFYKEEHSKSATAARTLEEVQYYCSHTTPPPYKEVC